jgi:hypothetical protein
MHPARARVGQLRQLVGVSALEFGKTPVLQDFGREREIFRQLLQHFFVGRAGRGEFDW